VDSSQSEGILRDDSLDVQKRRRAERFGLDRGSQTGAKPERFGRDVLAPCGSNSGEQQMKRAERFGPEASSGGLLARQKSAETVDEHGNRGNERHGPVAFLIPGTSSGGDSADKKRRRMERFSISVGVCGEEVKRIVRTNTSQPVGAKEGSSQAVAAQPIRALATTTLPAVATDEAACRQARGARKEAVPTKPQTVKMEAAAAKPLMADSEADQKRKRAASFADPQPPLAAGSSCSGNQVASLNSSDLSRLSEAEKRALRAQRFK